MEYLIRQYILYWEYNKRHAFQQSAAVKMFKLNETIMLQHKLFSILTLSL